MKISHFFGLSFLIVSLALSEATDQNGTDLSNIERIFGNVNPDVQYLILELLSLSDLAVLAENKKFSDVASQIFNIRYAHKNIKFVGPYRRNVVLKQYLSNDSVFFDDVDTFLQVVKVFGHFITDLEISIAKNHNRSAAETAAMAEHVNKYCAKSLVNFLVDYEPVRVNDKFFSKMRQPFPKVENFTVSGQLHNFDGFGLPVEELFPALRRAAFKSLYSVDASSIERVFPHLEELYIYVSPRNDIRRFTESDVKSMLELNPQIRSLRVNYCTRAFLKIVNEVLPNLEKIDIEDYQISTIDENNDKYLDEVIQFKTVKSFTTRTGTETVPKNIKFDALEEFNTNAFPGTCNRWIDLVEQTKSLKRLRVLQGNVCKKQLEKLSELDLNLDEVHLDFKMDVTYDVMARFVRICETAQRIEFAKNIATQDMTNVLREQVADGQWSIGEDEHTTFLNRLS